MFPLFNFSHSLSAHLLAKLYAHAHAPLKATIIIVSLLIFVHVFLVVLTLCNSSMANGLY